VAEVVTAETALLLVLVAVTLPVVLAPVVALRRADRATGAQVQMMIAPPLVPVGAPSDLRVQVTAGEGKTLPPVSLERPDHARKGDPAPPSRRVVPRPVLVAPDVGRLLRCDGAATGKGASAALPLPTRRRGIFTIGPLRVWAHDPFALCGMPIAAARPVTLVVHPPAVIGTTPLSVRPGVSGSAQPSDGPSGARADDPGGEWSGLRPYEPGDRLHLLSWQAEARSGALLVHDFRPDSEDVVTLILDDRAGVHRRDAFEQALGVLYGLAVGSEGSAIDYDVSTLSGRGVRGSTTPDGLVALATFLAETQPTRAAAQSALPALPAGALVLTTPTALPTLSGVPDGGSVVVVE
jgi:uncharacterized protein (DUF58 family)